MKYILVPLAILIVLILCIFLWSTFVIERHSPHSIAPSQTQFVTLSNGEEIAYQEISHNSQTSVVFVGGLSGWSGTWARSMKELDALLQSKSISYNLIALDLPPFGYSTSNLSAGFSREVQAHRINEFMQVKKLSNVIFVGHSYGAGPLTEALMTSTSSTTHIQKLVIVDGVLNIGEEKIVKKGLFTNTSFLNAFVKIFSHSTFVAKNRLGSFIYKKDFLDNDLAHLYTQPFSIKGNSKRLAVWIRDYSLDPLKYKSTQEESYKALTIPVRVIWGDKDTVTPPLLADKLFALLKNGKKYLLTDVGHIPMIENYKQFDDALLRAIVE